MTALELAGIELAKAVRDAEDESPETGEDFIGGAALSRLRRHAEDVLREAARTVKPSVLA